MNRLITQGIISILLSGKLECSCSTKTTNATELFAMLATAAAMTASIIDNVILAVDLVK